MTTPALSIVVAASNGPDRLAATLASLAPARKDGCEVVAVHNFPAPGPDPPGARTILAEAGTTVPRLRTLGIEHSQGHHVALIEDNVVVTPAWHRALLAAAERHPNAALGGPVTNAADSTTRDWAVFLYEYGRYLPPLPDAPADALPGNNLCYPRSLLRAYASAYADGFYETFFHERLHADGRPLRFVPDAVVQHTMQYATAATCRTCFHHARAYAGMRTAEAPVWKRGLMAVGSALLPALLPGRIAARTWSRRPHRRHLLRSLPHLTLFMTCWALGEGAGYLTGAGRSAKAWS